MERMRLHQAVIVEGKYDKIKLESVVDALILTTGGFQIYKDKERRALLRSLAQTCGLVVLTDSDGAGFRLRGYLNGISSMGITHVYIPDVFGKERRKRAPSAEGKIGVEGIDPATLQEAFRRAGVLEESAPPQEPVTRQDFYEDGLMGGPGSAERRRALYRRLGLPERLSTSAAIDAIAHMLTREEYKAALAEFAKE